MKKKVIEENPYEEAEKNINEKMKEYLRSLSIAVEYTKWKMFMNWMDVYVINGNHFIESVKIYLANRDKITEYFLNLLDEYNLKEPLLKHIMEFEISISKTLPENYEYKLYLEFKSVVDRKVNEFIRKNKSKAREILREILPRQVSSIYCHSAYDSNLYHNGENLDIPFSPSGYYVFINTMKNYEAIDNDDARLKQIQKEFLEKFKVYDTENILSEETLVLTFLSAKDKNGKSNIDYGFTRED